MDYCAALVVSTPKPPRPEDRVRHETNGKKAMAGSYLSILVDTHTRMGRGGIPALLENPFSGGFMLRLHLRKVPAHAASLGLLPLQEVTYKRVKKHWNPCQASPHPAEGNPCGGFMLRFAGCCTSTFPGQGGFMLRLHLRKVPTSGKKPPLVLHPALSQSSNKDVRQVDFVSGSRVSSPPHYNWRFHATFTPSQSSSRI